ncbi:hypothetical protein Ga0102493_11816 [Erythrobacter litoralis]|nr:hypothetical protein Ga0102493_11816 [Erythrobacter litoralis]
MPPVNAASSRPDSDPRTGFLGRGPHFWAGLFVASSLALGLLRWTGAIEGLEIVLVLALVPLALLAAVFRAAQLSARSKAEAGSRGLAQARYVKRTALFTSLYLVAVASLSLFGDETGPQAVRVLLALLPGLAIIGVFWAIGRLMVEEEDEFLAMLTVRQSLVATAVALSAASVWGFLESADLVPHLDAWWVAVAWFFGLFVGAAFNRVQHGTWGSA